MWRICCALVIITSILTFTPLVTPSGIYKPMLFGMPYTMWMGLVESFVLLLLTYIGTRVHPGRQEKN